MQIERIILTWSFYRIGVHLWWLPHRISDKCVRLVRALRKQPQLDFSVDMRLDADASRKGYSAHEAASVPMMKRLFRLCGTALSVDLDKCRFVDVGCGKGAVLIAAHECGFAKVGGIELNASWAETARRNLEIMRYTDVDVLCKDATAVDTELDDYDFFFLYNPFPAPVVDAFLDRLDDSQRRKPRRLVIVYNYPRAFETVEKHAFRKKREFILHDPWRISRIYLYTRETPPDES